MGGWTIFMIVLGGGEAAVASVSYVLCVCNAQIYAPGAIDVDVYQPGAVGAEVYRPGASQVQIGCEC